MQAIWKYPIQITDVQYVTMPLGSEILCVQMQREIPCLWARVITDEKNTEDVKILVYGTGHEYNPIIGNYIGTIQQNNGQFVWHVYSV